MAQLGLLPQGQPERIDRVLKMVAQMDEEGFGNCTNHGECEAVCPKQISIDFIARLNRDLGRRPPALPAARFGPRGLLGCAPYPAIERFRGPPYLNP